MLRVLLIASAAAAFAFAGCGDDGGDTTSEADAESVGVELQEPPEGGGLGDRAQGIADCAEEDGFEPTISQIANGATAVDLTTESATIVVQLYDSDEAAAAAAKDAPLEVESFGDILLLGGAIPQAQRTQIATCIVAG